MDSVNVACVGVGYWGKNLVRNFSSLPDCNLKTCCDLSPELLAATRLAYPGVVTTANFDEVLSDPAIEAVVLASPAAHHHAMALSALKSGKHVYVEKPLTLRVDHAEELCDVADQMGLTLMVGHLMEYHPAVEKLKLLIDSGDLGDIHYVYAQRLNLGIIRQDENAFWSLAPHDVSIILYLLGKDPISCSTHGGSYLQKDLEDVVFCNLHFDDGKMANIHVSWLDPHRVRKITVVGSQKMAVFDDIEATEKVRIYDKGVDGADYQSYGDALTLRTGDIVIPRIEMAEPLKIECAHFIDCVRTGAPPRSDGQDGLRVVRVLAAAEASIKANGQPIPIAPSLKS